MEALPCRRDTVGSWLEVRQSERGMRNEITIGGGHAGGSLGWRHFGIGGAAETEKRVVWPDGDAGDWQKVAGDRFYIIEPASPPLRWTP